MHYMNFRKARAMIAKIRFGFVNFFVMRKSDIQTTLLPDMT